jgi:transposase
VRQVATGEKRPSQICRERKLAESVLLRWRHEYAERGEAFTDKQPSELEALQARIAERERFVGQRALDNAVLKKALAAARAHNDTRCLLS